MTDPSPEWDHPRGAAALRLLVEVGGDHGLSAADCLRGTGLRDADLHQPSCQCEAGHEITVARNLIRRLGDRPGLGTEAGARYTFGTLGIWGYALMSSARVRDVVRLSVRYADLCFAFVRPVVHQHPGELAVVCDDSEIPSDVREFFVERELTKVARLLPVALGRHSRLRIETALTGARAQAVRDHAGRIEVRGELSCHRVVLDNEILDSPLPQADPITARELERQCARLLEFRRGRRGTAAHVRSLLLAELDGAPTMAAIAALLHLDPRTLRRRLRAEGTSFRELADEVHAAMAEELLRAGLTVSETAFRLGYHDAAGFTRAYRRWNGRTPGSAHPAPEKDNAAPESGMGRAARRP
ncbi:AraC family transcriptional regulator [Nocardia yunnanensis]|uniref:AraC family transcriptional regulator n=1 Tax=Nocardia yunnanensis TaxID=2382165 RepID=A0A386ZF84_9NOCA|nr:AraC family transcriptional regulator [Nocardia yunnanensis]AYF75873.1 AraC family transcriptional regulator [Nocardia yunnanensis]